MERFQFWALVLIITLLIALILITILPPAGWAVIGMALAAYALVWAIERASRRVWRR